MDITYTVHRASTHPVEVTVEYQGETARAMISELEVELFHGDAQHGSLCLHFRGQTDVNAAKEMFQQGCLVTLTFSRAYAPVDESPTA